MNKQLTFFDFFSGIGGFRIGLERAGFKCVGYCDNDKHANKLYSNYFNTEAEWVKVVPKLLIHPAIWERLIITELDD